MLTTIFTGHTIDLTDIVSVGPIMAAHKPSRPFIRRTMYLEIHLKGNTTLRHEEFHQTYWDGQIEPQQAEAWQLKHDHLNVDRTKLIEQWQQARSI